jgi:hypothetical protein
MQRPARWLIPEPNSDTAQALARELGIRMPAARVLAARGYADPAAARRFLSPELADLLDPLGSRTWTSRWSGSIAPFRTRKDPAVRRL